MFVIRLPNGNLRVPQSAIAHGGRVIGDVYVEIGPQDADYSRLADHALTPKKPSSAVTGGGKKTRRSAGNSLSSPSEAANPLGQTTQTVTNPDFRAGRPTEHFAMSMPGGTPLPGAFGPLHGVPPGDARIGRRYQGGPRPRVHA